MQINERISSFATFERKEATQDLRKGTSPISVWKKKDLLGEECSAEVFLGLLLVHAREELH